MMFMMEERRTFSLFRFLGPSGLAEVVYALFFPAMVITELFTQLVGIGVDSFERAKLRAALLPVFTTLYLAVEIFLFSKLWFACNHIVGPYAVLSIAIMFGIKPLESTLAILFFSLKVIFVALVLFTPIRIPLIHYYKAHEVILDPKLLSPEHTAIQPETYIVAAWTKPVSAPRAASLVAFWWTLLPVEVMIALHKYITLLWITYKP